jgi:hypothetical protein
MDGISKYTTSHNHSWCRPLDAIQLFGDLGDERAFQSSSVVDRYHRAHDVPNLFICDGSSFVTSGRGQPTVTIKALAFRAGDHIARFARRGEI